MNDYINQLKAYRDDGIRPDAPWLQAMLQGDMNHAFAIATPKTLAEMQDAWAWMVDNIPSNIRVHWTNYERHIGSFKPTLEDCPNEL